jgi:hypothetical protein
MWSGLNADGCWPQLYNPLLQWIIDLEFHLCKHRRCLLLGGEISKLISRTDIFNINMLLLAPFFDEFELHIYVLAHISCSARVRWAAS